VRKGTGSDPSIIRALVRRISGFSRSWKAGRSDAPGDVAVKPSTLALAAIAMALIGFGACYALMRRPRAVASARVPRVTAVLEAPSPAAIEITSVVRRKDCRATVVTTPPGALVRWQGEVIGESPFEAKPIPCGGGKLVIKLRDFGRIVRPLDLQPNVPVIVREILAPKIPAEEPEAASSPLPAK
jgi:hypothetical protein